MGGCIDQTDVYDSPPSTGGFACPSLRIRLALALAVTAFSISTRAGAEGLEPRAYTNTPVGMNFLLVGYGYLRGDVAFDPALPVKDAHAQIRIYPLAYIRSLDVAGMSGKISFILPYADFSGSALVEGVGKKREVSGFADPAVKFSVNLYGAPALSLKDFASYQQDVIIGASLLVTAPLGQYDPERAINLGTNRWSFKPELGISKEWGPWTVELEGSATLFTTNHDFFGGNTREQDPIYATQLHLIRQFSNGVWGAVSTTYEEGGNTEVNGVRGDDRQENWRYGFTLAFPVDRYQSIKLYGSTGAYSRTETDYDVIGVAWQYRWGAGY